MHLSSGATIHPGGSNVIVSSEDMLLSSWVVASSNLRTSPGFVSGSSSSGSFRSSWLPDIDIDIDMDRDPSMLPCGARCRTTQLSISLMMVSRVDSSSFDTASLASLKSLIEACSFLLASATSVFFKHGHKNSFIAGSHSDGCAENSTIKTFVNMGFPTLDPIARPMAVPAGCFCEIAFPINQPAAAPKGGPTKVPSTMPFSLSRTPFFVVSHSSSIAYCLTTSNSGSLFTLYRWVGATKPSRSASWLNTLICCATIMPRPKQSPMALDTLANMTIHWNATT